MLSHAQNEQDCKATAPAIKSTESKSINLHKICGAFYPGFSIDLLCTISRYIRVSSDSLYQTNDLGLGITSLILALTAVATAGFIVSAVL
jgi:hypothetical protein